jgi:long-chain acyl-CoA synthetase
VEPRDEVRAQLTGAGGPFEMVEEEVLAARVPVFKNRLGSLRELVARSRDHGDKPYIVFGDTRLSYAEHTDRVASVAAALRDQYGIQPGDRVAILAANCPEWVISFWAVVSCGGIVAALNGWWTADEILYGISQAEPSLIIGDSRRLERIRDAKLDIPVVEIEAGFQALVDSAPEAAWPDTPIAEDDPCLILFTSGTTGRPKGALISHRALLGFTQCQALAGLERILVAARSQPPAAGGGLPAPPCMLVTMPLFHLSGLYAGAVMMLSVGGKTVYRPGRFDPEDVLRLIEQEGVTTWSALGNTGQRVATHASLEKYDLSSIQNIGFGGAPTSPALQQRLIKAFPNAASKLGMGYGLSESGGMGATIGGEELLRHPTSTGRATPGSQIEIRDADGNALPDREQGEIHLRSAYLMLGYWRDEVATREALLPDRWLATGDIGHLEDGLLYINSRARDMILRGAENIYPVEIENRLQAHASVAEAAVIGVEHPELGQEVKAVVVPAHGCELDTAQLASWAGKTLAPFKVPTQWEIRAEGLPRNAAGKVLKTVLTGESENLAIEE